jgi:hypothetical protein
MHPISPFSEGYIESKKNEIETLEWLIAYYEGRTASTPKELLEATLISYGYYHHNFTLEEVNNALRSIVMLYDWVYKNRITGF